jgi:hypothetical protein
LCFEIRVYRWGFWGFGGDERTPGRGRGGARKKKAEWSDLVPFPGSWCGLACELMCGGIYNANGFSPVRFLGGEVSVGAVDYAGTRKVLWEVCVRTVCKPRREQAELEEMLLFGLETLPASIRGSVGEPFRPPLEKTAKSPNYAEKRAKNT